MVRYRTLSWCTRRIGVVLLTTLFGIALSWSQRLYWLGTLSEGTLSEAFGVLADGRLVVGFSTTQDTANPRAFAWTQSTGMVQLEFLSGDLESTAYGVSANGEVIVGYRMNPQRRFVPTRWVNGALQDVPLPSQGIWGYANKVSGDGTTVVGRYSRGAGRLRAFLYNPSEGALDLGALSDTAISEALGVSYDGSVIVGYSETLSEGPRAVIWTRSGGIQDISQGLPSRAFSVTPDGQVVVGSYGVGTQAIAFRWTASGGLETLGTFEGTNWTRPLAVSADGTILVGEAIVDPNDSIAVRWIAGVGWQDLNLVYESLLAPESVLLRATAISPDGRYIVGFGYNSLTDRGEAWLLDTVPEPASWTFLAIALTPLLKRRRLHQSKP